MCFFPIFVFVWLLFVSLIKKGLDTNETELKPENSRFFRSANFLWVEHRRRIATSPHPSGMLKRLAIVGYIYVGWYIASREVYLKFEHNRMWLNYESVGVNGHRNNLGKFGEIFICILRSFWYQTLNGNIRAILRVQTRDSVVTTTCHFAKCDRRGGTVSGFPITRQTNFNLCCWLWAGGIDKGHTQISKRVAIMGRVCCNLGSEQPVHPVKHE